MRNFSVIVLAIFCVAYFSTVLCEPQALKVTLRPDDHHVPDFLTEATPTTEPSNDVPPKVLSTRERDRLQEERFKSVKGTEPAAFWKDVAQEGLKERLSKKPIEKIAKNIIYFVGDGMSVPTITGARILKGQKSGYKFGEEAQLHMDTFPFLGASRTFCSDAQVADSACSATALFTGSKTNFKMIGVTPNVLVGDCTGQIKEENQLSSILEWAQKAGKSTGVVTTTRISHATPAGLYAHIAHRDWENDAEVAKAGFDTDKCDDIAEQLVLSEPGKNINVLMGGGRKHFIPSSLVDHENGQKGMRNDSKNLIEQWKLQKLDKRAKYVDNLVDLLRVNTNEVDYLLGLFAPDHIEYTDNLTMNHDPTLRNMTSMAIKILSKNPNGFFLMVEGGRIDHALHDNFGQRALVEAIELDSAIQHADEVTSDEDTLIVVTSDHSHVMSIAGYPVRGNPIMGIAETSDIDNLPYTTISFANGPGFRNHSDGFRSNVSSEDITKIDYKQHTGIPLKYETHGGEDVLIFSKGPYSHLLTGVNFQNYIPHLMAYASCIGPEGYMQSPLCEEPKSNEIDSARTSGVTGLMAMSSFSYFYSVIFVLVVKYQVQI